MTRTRGHALALLGPGLPLLVWLTLCTTGGCASSPRVEYFALEPIDGPAARLATTVDVQVARVHVPPSLDREQFVRQTGAYSLDISDRHRWSAPLDEMIRRVLTQDLMRILPAGRVVLPREPASPATLKIVVDILDFRPDAAGTIHLDVSWSIVGPDPGRVPRSTFVQLDEKADAGDPAAEVGAMSRALGKLAAHVARSLVAA